MLFSQHYFSQQEYRQNEIALHSGYPQVLLQVLPKSVKSIDREIQKYTLTGFDTQFIEKTQYRRTDSTAPRILLSPLEKDREILQEMKMMTEELNFVKDMLKKMHYHDDETVIQVVEQLEGQTLNLQLQVMKVQTIIGTNQAIE